MQGGRIVSCEIKTHLVKRPKDNYLLEQEYADIPNFRRFITLTKQDALDLLKQLKEEFPDHE